MSSLLHQAQRWRFYHRQHRRYLLLVHIHRVRRRPRPRTRMRTHICPPLHTQARMRWQAPYTQHLIRRHTLPTILLLLMQLAGGVGGEAEPGVGALFLPGRRPGRQRGRTRRGRARLALAPAVRLAQLQVDLGRAFKRRHGHNRWCNLQSKAVGSQHKRRYMSPLRGQRQQRRADGTRWTPGALR